MNHTQTNKLNIEVQITRTDEFDIDVQITTRPLVQRTDVLETDAQAGCLTNQNCDTTGCTVSTCPTCSCQC